MESSSRANAEQSLKVSRIPIRIDKHIGRVVTLPFNVGGYSQIVDVLRCVGDLTELQVEKELAGVLMNFAQRHEDYEKCLERHYDWAARIAQRCDGLSRQRRLLIGSYFTMEYSLEAAALFNPSITPHPDQSAVPPGSLRFIMSLRAVGEGHLSSTVFHTGLITKSGAVALDPPGAFSARTRIKPDHAYHKPLFQRKLEEMSGPSPAAEAVLGRLAEDFSMDQLEQSVAATKDETPDLPGLADASQTIIWLARANYQLELNADDAIGDLVLFPRSENEKRGIEDMRLARFVDEDGSACYFGTYTAFDGERILPMLMETKDFRTLKMHTLNGACVQNKGMALFPRKINGHYVMCSRIDGRNLYIMYSDYVRFWETAKLLATPEAPWELHIIGNCGPPLETKEGWLLITHGVGPMRRYCIGAMLLDLDDPLRIRGRLREPLLEPSEEEREGYTPNVVYSCGSLIHNGRLILPYAAADTATRMATVSVDDLVQRLLHDGP